MAKIQRISRTLQKIFQFFLIALPLFSIIFWFFLPIPNPLSISTRFFPKASDIVNTLDMTTRFLGFTVSLIPLGIEMFCIYCLIRLFNLFERGKIFTAQNVQYIRYIGIAMLVGEIVKPFYEAVTTLIMHYHNPRGHEMLHVSLFSGDEISYILISIIILLISWVMIEACKLQEEHAYTV